MSFAMILNMGVPALAQASEPSLASEPAAAESSSSSAESSSSAGSSSSAAGNGDLAIDASSVTITITAFDALPTVVMQQPIVTGTAVEQLHLPAELNATGEAAPEAITIVGVTWQIDPAHPVNDGNETYDPQGGTDCFTPLLPVGYTVAQGVSLPEILPLPAEHTVRTIPMQAAPSLFYQKHPLPSVAQPPRIKS